MQRPTSQLGHHLLTRSDLAALAVRATEVFRWLAEGAIEQVGDLPRAASEPDPVFAVNSDQLRTELVARLARIGKSPVVLTPLGVRSFLLRALLLHNRAAESVGATGTARELAEALDAGFPAPGNSGAIAAGHSVEASVAEHLLTTDLAAVLQDALLEVAPDVEAMLQLAAEIAAAESAAPSHAPWAGPDDDDAAESLEDATPSSTEDYAEPEFEFEFDHGDFEADGDDDDFDACFDLDELSKLDATTPASHRETVMAEPFDAPHQAPDDNRPEPAIAEASTASQPACEELLAPEAEPEVEAVDDPVADDEQGDDARTFEQAVEGAIGAVVEANEGLDAGGSVDDSTVVGDAEVPPATATEPKPVTIVKTVAAPDHAEAVADAGADTAVPGSDDTIDVPTVATGISDENVVDEALAGSSSLEDAASVPIDEDAREPVLAAEEAETVNEAETDVDAAIEMPSDQDAVANGELLQDPAGVLLEQDVAEPEPESELAAVMEPATAEPSTAEPDAELPAMTTAHAASFTAEPPRDGPAFDEALVDAVTEAVEARVANATEPVGDEFALTSQAMDKVQDFLGELRSALVEMAQRPQQQASTPSIDVAPLIEAVQAGFDRSAEQAGQASSALASLAERVGQFGQQVESSVHQSVKALAEQQQLQETQGRAPVAVADRPRFLVQRPGRQALVLGAVAILVLCWSILFWFKTGSPRLAFGTLIGANLVGCCLLVARRD